MEGIFTEFENENALRAYPFSSACLEISDSELSISPDVFVDAMFYPINPSGGIYLSGVSEEGIFSVSDSSGVIMTGTRDGSRVEFYDTSKLSRHVGTLVASSEDALAEFAGRGGSREWTSSQTLFASACVSPIVVDRVMTVDVGESGKIVGNLSFANGDSDNIRVSSRTLGDGRKTIRFDVLPRPSAPEGGTIRRIICVVDGQTPFRIEKLAYNTVMVMLDGVDKGAVCSAAHRENQFEMADTCDCGKDPMPSEDPLPEVYQLEEVFIPPDNEPGHPEGGIDGGADNAFYLVVPNVSGYDNPISITLEDGVVAPKTEDVKVIVEGETANLAEGEMLDEVTSKGVVIQVPGLSGGNT